MPAFCPATFGTDAGEVLIGGPQGDTLYGGGGSDLVFGLGGADVLSGDHGSLTVTGSADLPDFGDDTLVGNVSDDSATGDATDLTMVFSGGEDLNVTLGDDWIDAQMGQDSAALDHNCGDVGTLTIALEHAGGGTVTFEGGNDTLLGSPAAELFGDAETVSVTHDGGGGEAVLHFGDDILIGGSQLVGDAAHLDTFGAGARAITIVGGDDLLIAQGSALLVGDFRLVNRDDAADPGAILICGNDTLVGSAKDDSFAGDHDYFIDDSIEVIKGADTFIFEDAWGNDEILDFDQGLDTVILKGFDGADDSQIVWTYDAEDDATIMDMTALGGGTITFWGLHFDVAVDIDFA